MDQITCNCISVGHIDQHFLNLNRSEGFFRYTKSLRIQATWSTVQIHLWTQHNALRSTIFDLQKQEKLGWPLGNVLSYGVNIPISLSTTWDHHVNVSYSSELSWWWTKLLQLESKNSSSKDVATYNNHLKCLLVKSDLNHFSF